MLLVSCLFQVQCILWLDILVCFRFILTMDLVQILLLLCSCLYVSVDSVMFFLEANARKCLAEEIRKDVLVTGEYEVTEMPGQQVMSRYLRLRAS